MAQSSFRLGADAGRFSPTQLADLLLDDLQEYQQLLERVTVLSHSMPAEEVEHFTEVNEQWQRFKRREGEEERSS